MENQQASAENVVPVPLEKRNVASSRISRLQLVAALAVLQVVGCSFSNRQNSQRIRNAPHMVFANSEQESVYGSRLRRRLERATGIIAHQIASYLESIARAEPLLESLRRSISQLISTGGDSDETRLRIHQLERQKVHTERELQCSIFNLLFEADISISPGEIPPEFDPEELISIEQTFSSDPSLYRRELELLRSRQLRILRELRVLIYAHSIYTGYSEETRLTRIAEVQEALRRRENVLAEIDLRQLGVSATQH